MIPNIKTIATMLAVLLAALGLVTACSSAPQPARSNAAACHLIKEATSASIHKDYREAADRARTHWLRANLRVIVRTWGSNSNANNNAVANVAYYCTPGSPSSSPSSSPSAAPATVSCSSFGGLLGRIVADMKAQQATMVAEGPGLSRVTKDQIAAGAWNPPGTYSGALDTLATDVNQQGISFGQSSLASTVWAIAHDGTSVQNDDGDGMWQADGDPASAEADWNSFVADIDGPDSASAAVTPLSSLC